MTYMSESEKQSRLDEIRGFCDTYNIYYSKNQDSYSQPPKPEYLSRRADRFHPNST